MSLAIQSREGKLQEIIDDIPTGKTFDTGVVIGLYRASGRVKFTPEANRITVFLKECPNVERLDKKLWKKI
jgi:hypothetical protein